MIALLRSQQNADLSRIPSTRERENHQIILLWISLTVPLAKHKIFTQTHVNQTHDRFNQSSFVVYENIESLLLKTIKGDDTSDDSEYIKQIYNDETNITQFEIEADVLHVIFDKKKVDCFDRFLSDIRKLPRNQRLGSVN